MRWGVGSDGQWQEAARQRGRRAARTSTQYLSCHAIATPQVHHSSQLVKAQGLHIVYMAILLPRQRRSRGLTLTAKAWKSQHSRAQTHPHVSMMGWDDGAADAFAHREGKVDDWCSQA